MTAPFVIGRMIFGGFFLYNGINHFLKKDMLTQYASSKNIPNADVGVLASGAMLIAGGASLISGVQPKIGAMAIVAFLAGVSPTMHDFWRVEDPNQRSSEMINFTKNMALLGSALAFMSIEEPWPVSLQGGEGRHDRMLAESSEEESRMVRA